MPRLQYDASTKAKAVRLVCEHAGEYATGLRGGRGRDHLRMGLLVQHQQAAPPRATATSRNRGQVLHRFPAMHGFANCP
jgi:hypothetical protein